MLTLLLTYVVVGLFIVGNADKPFDSTCGYPGEGPQMWPIKSTHLREPCPELSPSHKSFYFQSTPGLCPPAISEMGHKAGNYVKNLVSLISCILELNLLSISNGNDPAWGTDTSLPSRAKRPQKQLHLPRASKRQVKRQSLAKNI